MGDRNLELEYRQEEFKRLEQYSQTLQENIPATIDPLARQALESRLLLTFKQLDETQTKIDALEQAAQSRAVQERDRTLLTLLEAHTDALPTVQAAYQTTLTHWPTAVSPLATAPAAMLRELKRISPAEGYSALEEFVSQMIAQTTSDALLNALNAWGQRHYPTRDWLALHHYVQQQFASQMADFRPAILVRLRLAEETTAQTDTPHYLLAAWLVEDIATYQDQRTGYHPLVLSGKDTEPVALDNITAHMRPLLGDWLRQTRRMLPDCNNDPAFHIFLPKGLLQLDIDCWPLDSIYLGHAYTVVVCCTDRLDGPYPRGLWRQLWDRHQTCLSNPAREVFVDDDGQDIARLAETLNNAVRAESIVGLTLTAAPCQPTLDDVFDELLLAGLPVALWGRCQETSIDNPRELDTILREGPLSRLPQTVQGRRRGARRTSPDSHIGHHLVLLQDNPKLIPP